VIFLRTVFALLHSRLIRLIDCLKPIYPHPVSAFSLKLKQGVDGLMRAGRQLYST